MRILVSGLALALVCLAQQPQLRFAGPYQHANLTVYLLHTATATASGRPYLPLKQAIEQGKVVVHETKNVNELAIENLSSDADVFVQGGDIVKGGQQDRVFTTDLILPPKSGRTPIATFCVEQGRWSKRGTESDRTFQASSETIAHKRLKLAVKDGKDQQRVWSEVAVANAGLALASASSTSYQLNVESKEVAARLDAYLKALLPSLGKQRNPVGFVYSVNGAFAGAEVYASPGLFAALWPKLLKSAAVEASAAPAQKTMPLFREADARQAISLLPEPATTGVQPNRRTLIKRTESEKALLVESKDSAAGQGGWLHRSYVAK